MGGLTGGIIILAGVVVMLVIALKAKAKKADHAEQQLKAEKDMRDEAVKIHKSIHDRSSDIAERDRVRDKYTRTRE